MVLGDRTGSREFAGEIAQEHPSPEIIFIDEHMSSMEGRRRYLLDHPRPGLGKLIPVSLGRRVSRLMITLQWFLPKDSSNV